MKPYDKKWSVLIRRSRELINHSVSAPGQLDAEEKILRMYPDGDFVIVNTWRMKADGRRPRSRSKAD